MLWQTTRFEIDLAQPRVMAIVNLTPDSFFDGRTGASAADALARCEAFLKDGADLLDLGAESSRPGAAPVPIEEEWARLRPVLVGALSLGCPISVDTYKAEVMQRALDLGADIVNDIAALRGAGALEAVAAHPRCGVCLMHMHGTPVTMQDAPLDGDAVVGAVLQFLRERVGAVRSAGVADRRILVDPGIGFGKTSNANLALLRRQDELLAIGLPLLVGWSRKGTLGKVTGRSTGDRMIASVAAALAALARGASVVRVHDVAATVDAFKVWNAAGLASASRTTIRTELQESPTQ